MGEEVNNRPQKEPENDEGKPKTQQPNQERHCAPQRKANRATARDTGTTQRDREARDRTEELGGQRGYRDIGNPEKRNGHPQVPKQTAGNMDRKEAAQPAPGETMQAERVHKTTDGVGGGDAREVKRARTTLPGDQGS